MTWRVVLTAMNCNILFIIASLLLASCILAARDEPNRNVLHYTPVKGLQGTVAGAHVFPSRPSTLYVYFEQTSNQSLSFSNMSRTWWIASSEDGGVTWTDEGKGFIPDTVDARRGGFVSAAADDGFDALVLYTSTERTAGSTVSTHSWIGTGALTPKATNLEHFTKIATRAEHSSPCPFLVQNDDGSEETRYLATLSSMIEREYCGVLFSTLPGVSLLRFDLPEVECRGGLSFFQLNKKWVLLYTGSAASGHPQSKYYIGDIERDTTTDKFKFTPDTQRAMIFDAGHDAHDFSIASVNGISHAFGWNGNSVHAELVPTKTWKNGLTVPRRLWLSDGILHQAPISFSARVKQEHRLPKANISRGLEALCFNFEAEMSHTKNSAYIFEFTFSHKRPAESDFSGGGYGVQFFSKNWRTVTLGLHGISDGSSVVPNYWMDRNMTEFSPEIFPPSVLATGIEDSVSPINGKLTIVLDRTTIEAFFEEKYVITENYFLPDRDRLHKVCLESTLRGIATLESGVVYRVQNVFADMDDDGDDGGDDDDDDDDTGDAKGPVASLALIAILGFSTIFLS